jgi:hypothetical protein
LAEAWTLVRAAILVVKVSAEVAEAVDLKAKVRVQTDEIEHEDFDNKGILGYLMEKEYLSIVKEWNSKGAKQL